MIFNFLSWLGIHVHEWGEWKRESFLLGMDSRGTIHIVRKCKTCGKEEVHLL